MASEYITDKEILEHAAKYAHRYAGCSDENSLAYAEWYLARCPEGDVSHPSQFNIWLAGATFATVLP